MNGVDVSKLKVGDVIALPTAQATMMVECGWAEHLPDDVFAAAAPRTTESHLTH
jgi:hypothetical protein